MAETLTDADTFNSTIQMPTSGENVSASDLRDKAIQRLANRTNFLNLRTTSRAAYSITGGSVSSGNLFTLTELFDQNSLYSVASNEVTVPAVGRYMVYVQGYVSAASGGGAGATARISTSSTIASTWDTAVAARTQGSGTSGYVCGVGVINITNVSTEKIEVASAISTGNVTINAESWIIIERVS